GVRLEFENHGAGDVRRAVVNGDNGNHGAVFAGRNGHETRQGDVIHAVGGGTADGVMDGQGIVGGAEAMDGEGGVLGAAVGEGPAEGAVGAPGVPGGSRVGQPGPGITIGALNGDRVSGNDIDHRWPI